ncbi:MAG: hypothetical protein Kow00117_11390 [Phototrophicales bacterium]
MQYLKKIFLIGLLMLLAVMFGTAQAGDVILSNNSGSASTVWYITGEKSLVMNGFDLQSLGIQRPVQVEKITLAVQSPVPGQLVDAVVYQDANGGSPIDATLAGSQQVSITEAGVFTVTFSPPIQITQPVIWAGFYLPVDFEFLADRSGTSVLTYWAWQPNSTFNLSNLSSAAVFGPADGSAPVNINMNGIARITVELNTGGQTPTGAATPTPVQQVVTNPEEPLIDSQGRILQIFGGNTADLSSFSPYTLCQTLYWDRADVNYTYRDSVELGCKLVDDRFIPANPEGYARSTGVIYDVTLFGRVSPGTNPIPYPITHCVVPQGGVALERGVIGLAWGAPREWEILPTVRYGNFLCAELYTFGNVAVFIPN